MSYNDATARATAQMRLSFVLPMYNEALNIEAMAAMIRRDAAPLLDDYEIVIVDDASTDGCGAIADRMARDDARIRVIHNPRNRGLGGSIRVGLAAARMPYVLYSDSDLPVDFECLRWVLPKVTPEVDLLIGYRVGRAEGVRRAIMSWTYNRLIRAIFGLRVRDVNFAFKLIRRDLLERLDLHSEGSFIDAEILLEARRAGATPVEVGLDYHIRRAGASSLSSPAVVFKILAEMWRYLTRDHDRAYRAVIINGDDFGLHRQVNLGILEAHRDGVLTSASILAAGEAFADAVAIARQCPRLEVGVHLALTEVTPCAPPAQVPALVDGSGRFSGNTLAVIGGIIAGRIPAPQIEAEFRAQLERVRAAGLPISHLDGHQHVHMAPACARVVARLAREYGIVAVRLSREPLSWPCSASPARKLERFLLNVGLRVASWRAARIFRRAGLAFPDRFFGFANAGRMEREIAARLAAAEPGVTEIGCHPGLSDADLDRVTGWGYHWEQETQALCCEDARAALNRSGAQLGSWATCRTCAPADS
jgi:hopanoid biosynthesis associated protein HpnK